MIGISRLPVHETPVVVIDCETTGLNAKYDRIVEVSIVKIEPGQAPRLAFDTLVNPGRGVGATEIHGITNEDVADAPMFDEIAGDLARAVSGCVVSAYNAYFDVKFLTRELERSDIQFDIPYFCLMYMRPMLGLGARCSLGDACLAHDIDHVDTHVASSDAIAASRLWAFYLGFMHGCRISTFGDLMKLKSYKFCESFSSSPLETAFFDAHPTCDRMTSRSSAWLNDSALPTPTPPPQQVNPVGVYWESLKAIIYDLQVTEEEELYIKQKGQELELSVDEIRALHAKLYAARKLQRLTQCLQRLGWAPGD